MFLLRYINNLFIKLAVYAITAYQKYLSPDHGINIRATCRFSPTCSEYTKQAIKQYSVVGIFLGLWHFIRCNQLLTPQFTYEPVPENLFNFSSYFFKKKK